MPRRIKIEWEPIKLLFASGKTARELSIIFGISEANILQKSKIEKWGVLRKQVKAADPSIKMNRQPRNPTLINTVKDGILVESKSAILNTDAKSENERSQDYAISRAVMLRNSDNFRNRVVNEANKALSVLEKATPSNVFETDRFADALTKVERIGARAYGYDREGQQPVINIGILGTGSEYDAV